jgi:hypothetical protein
MGEASVKLLEGAEHQFATTDMALYGMAAQRTRGRLLGGERGSDALGDYPQKGGRSHPI